MLDWETTPEINLWRAVINDILFDIIDGVRSDDFRNVKMLVWYMEGEDFEMICQMAALDKYYILRKLNCFLKDFNLKIHEGWLIHLPGRYYVG